MWNDLDAKYKKGLIYMDKISAVKKMQIKANSRAPAVFWLNINSELKTEPSWLLICSLKLKIKLSLDHQGQLKLLAFNLYRIQPTTVGRLNCSHLWV